MDIFYKCITCKRFWMVHRDLRYRSDPCKCGNMEMMNHFIDGRGYHIFRSKK